jgi:mannose-6-phosphate isomerase
VTQPVVLPVNQIDHFYLGGDRIGALRHGPGGPRRPEEWLGSAVSRFGTATQGLTVLPDGTFLRDAIAADPERWVGPEHAARWGATPGVLVKLLDAGERLPVHVHPTRSFARDHLDCPYGKTEAWVVIDTPPGGAPVYLGTSRDVEHAEWQDLVARQDKAAMLALLHEVVVTPGDAVLVPSGTAHAIGDGVFVVELQEPTDFSVLLEWDGFALDGPAEGHLGLGFDVALECLRRDAFGPDDLDRLTRRGASHDDQAVASALPEAADPYFRAIRVRTAGQETLPAGFAVVVALDGEGTLVTDGARTPLPRGTAVVVPHAAGPLRFQGPTDVLVSRPAAPGAPEPHEWDASDG